MDHRTIWSPSLLLALLWGFAIVARREWLEKKTGWDRDPSSLSFLLEAHTRVTEYSHPAGPHHFFSTLFLSLSTILQPRVAFPSTFHVTLFFCSFWVLVIFFPASLIYLAWPFSRAIPDYAQEQPLLVLSGWNQSAACTASAFSWHCLYFLPVSLSSWPAWLSPMFLPLLSQMPWLLTRHLKTEIQTTASQKGLWWKCFTFTYATLLSR